MPSIVNSGQSIEGSKVIGNSRKPIEYKGVFLENGERIHRFISKFNTRARVEEELAAGQKKIIDSALTSKDNEVVCDDAVVRSIDQKCSRALRSNASGTHGTTVWRFTRQTNVMIVKSHDEIARAIEKRLEIEANKRKN